MLCTDSLEYIVVHPDLNAAQRIPAQNIHVVYLGEFVAELFNLNRGICLTPFPQEMHIFCENSNAEMLPLCRLRRSLNGDCCINHVIGFAGRCHGWFYRAGLSESGREWVILRSSKSAEPRESHGQTTRHSRRSNTPSSAAQSTWRWLASVVGGQCRPHQSQIRTLAIVAVCYF